MVEVLCNQPIIKMRKTLLLAPILVLLAGPSFAQNSQHANLAQQIYTTSSLSRFVEETSGQIDELSDATHDELDAEQAAHLGRVLGNAFSSEQMKADILSSMTNHMDASIANRVITWLEQPFTQRMQAMEAQSADQQQSAMMYMESLNMEDPAIQNKIAAVEAYLQDTGAVDKMLSILSSTMMSMMRASSQVADNSVSFTDEDIAMQAEIIESQLRPQFEPAMVMLMLYNFRDASIEDIQNYSSYYTTEDGKWYSMITANAIQDAFSGAAERMAVELSTFAN